MLLKHYLELLSTMAIAERIGVSGWTIYHWIKSGQLDRDLDAETVRYPPRPTKLDPYKAMICERLTQLRDFVRKIRPVPPAEELIRFETPPGQQGQVDFPQVRCRGQAPRAHGDAGVLEAPVAAVRSPPGDAGLDPGRRLRRPRLVPHGRVCNFRRRFCAIRDRR